MRGHALESRGLVVLHLPADQAQALADAAEQRCPYSNATRGNVDVRVTVVDGRVHSGGRVQYGR